jgi:Holliday junction resolvase RusA-like endonuclease
MRLNITPLGKPRMTQRNKWYTPPALQKYWDYANELKRLLPDYQLPIILNIVFYIPFPKSYSHKKRRELIGLLHMERPDIDNLAKGFMDAFKDNGTDDKKVAILHAEKYWADQGGIVLQHVTSETKTNMATKAQ